MPSHQLKDERVGELAGLVQGWGKLLSGEAYGPEGPGFDVDLAGMEELATIMQQALLEGFCEEMTQRQADRLPETQACPQCGSECEVEPCTESAEGAGPMEDEPAADEPAQKTPGKKPPGPRCMQLRHGTFKLKESACYCRRCRRYFFPSADGLAD